MPGASWALANALPDHDGIRAAGERFANIAALAHSAIGDDRNVTRSFLEIGIARRRAIDGGGDLRHAQAEHAARSAGRAGTDADQHRRRTAFHDLERHLVTDGVADDDRDPHLAAKFREIERFIFGGNVPHGRDRALHDENIRARFLRDRAELARRVAEWN